MNFELKKITLLIFTDIDGTFINNDTFHEGSNIRVAETLHKYNHMLIYNSSKTFNEIVFMQKKFNTSFPFICETGGGIYHKNLFDRSIKYTLFCKFDFHGPGPEQSDKNRNFDYLFAKLKN